MFKDLLSSRWIQGGLVFFIVVLSGSQLYSWHVRRTAPLESATVHKAVAPQDSKAQEDQRLTFHSRNGNPAILL